MPTRRRFLRLLGVGTGLGGSAVASEHRGPGPSSTATARDSAGDGRTISVDAYETKTITLGSGETLSDLVVDISSRGAAFRLHADGEDWTIRNLGVHGKQGRSLTPFSLSGTGQVRDVYLGDGVEAPYPRRRGMWAPMASGVWVDHQASERIDFERVNVQNWSNNGIYGSPTEEEDRGAVVTIRDSYFARNNVSAFKLGSPLDDSVVSNVTIRTDDPPPTAWNGELTPAVARAVWALDNRAPASNRVVLRDCDIDGALVAECGAHVVLDGTRWRGEWGVNTDVHGCYSGAARLFGTSAGQPELSPPENVPLTAVGAATGSGS